MLKLLSLAVLSLTLAVPASAQKVDPDGGPKDEKGQAAEKKGSSGLKKLASQPKKPLPFVFCYKKKRGSSIVIGVGPSAELEAKMNKKSGGDCKFISGEANYDDSDDTYVFATKSKTKGLAGKLGGVLSRIAGEDIDVVVTNEFDPSKQ